MARLDPPGFDWLRGLIIGLCVAALIYLPFMFSGWRQPPVVTIMGAALVTCSVYLGAAPSRDDPDDW